MDELGRSFQSGVRSDLRHFLNITFTFQVPLDVRSKVHFHATIVLIPAPFLPRRPALAPRNSKGNEKYTQSKFF